MGAELSNPATKAFVITPSDTTDIREAAGFYPRSLYIGTTGNLLVVMLDDTGTDTTVLFTAVPVGILPIRVKKVYAATTASTIVALG